MRCSRPCTDRCTVPETVGGTEPYGAVRSVLPSAGATLVAVPPARCRRQCGRPFSERPRGLWYGQPSYAERRRAIASAMALATRSAAATK